MTNRTLFCFILRGIRFWVVERAACVNNRGVNELSEINKVAAALTEVLPSGKEAVVLAIGSDRVTGDCLGPLVGYLLQSSGLKVYGSLRSPVTALGVEETYDNIKKRHPKAVVIAVDSAVGEDCEIGEVRAIGRGLRPAAAMGKKLRCVGDASVIGVVSAKRMGAKGLGQVRLGDVYKMAHIVARAIEISVNAKQKAVTQLKAAVL